MSNYNLIGIVITLTCIFYYRKDGTTKKPFELYLAAIGFLIWPLLLIKVIYDFIRKQIPKK